ncbi:proline-rich protein HaeIII subfamily 1-like [Pipra filicauda]|uniref:Proline-rich protein HaeIII subfamily 1-like n=1 Tax=Pipra filicauda TaxID=649802 RepID=A0A7R5KP83_9PASS|nr:proline-rich protein HaeIII subfamily 1-like [Pipra filicauda]
MVSPVCARSVQTAAHSQLLARSEQGRASPAGRSPAPTASCRCRAVRHRRVTAARPHSAGAEPGARGPSQARAAGPGEPRAAPGAHAGPAGRSERGGDPPADTKSGQGRPRPRGGNAGGPRPPHRPPPRRVRQSPARRPAQPSPAQSSPAKPSQAKPTPAPPPPLAPQSRSRTAPAHPPASPRQLLPSLPAPPPFTGERAAPSAARAATADGGARSARPSLRDSARPRPARLGAVGLRSHSIVGHRFMESQTHGITGSWNHRLMESQAPGIIDSWNH